MVLWCDAGVKFSEEHCIVHDMYNVITCVLIDGTACVLRSKSANYSEVPVVPEVSSPQERSTQARMNTVRPPPGLVFQCSPLLTDSHFDVRQAMQTPPTGVFDQGAAPWVLPQPSSPGMYLPPSSPLSVVFVQPIIATSPMSFLPQSSGGFVSFEPNLSASRQVPTTAVLSGMSTVSTSTPPTPSPATFANSADWLSNVTSHNDEPPLQGLPFLSRRESTAMQATASDSSGASHRERHSPTLSLALPSSSDLVQQSEPAVTSPACPSTPILSQCPLTSSSISYLFGNNTTGMAALGKRSSDSRLPVAGTLLQPPSQRPRTIVLNGSELVIRMFEAYSLASVCVCVCVCACVCVCVCVCVGQDSNKTTSTGSSWYVVPHCNYVKNLLIFLVWL